MKLKVAFVWPIELPLIGKKEMSSYVKDANVIYNELMDNYEKIGRASCRERV